MRNENSSPGTNLRASGRKPDDYRRLAGLDRTGWAWEWLRRNPDFLGAVSKISQNRWKSTHSSSYGVYEIESAKLSRWGVLFCRRARIPRILVASTQSTHPACRGDSHLSRQCRRIRPPAMPTCRGGAVLRRTRTRAFQRWPTPSPTDGDGGQRPQWPSVPPLSVVGFPAYGCKGSGFAATVRALPPRPLSARPLPAGAPGQALGDDAARLGRRDGGCEPAPGGGGDLRGNGSARALGVRLPLPHATACPRGRGDGQRRLPETLERATERKGGL